MNNIERIYSLLLHSNGLKIREISKELDLDKYYVAEIMFSSENISYWYQNDDSLWYAKEGTIQIEEAKEKKDELLSPAENPYKFNINRFLDEDLSESLLSYLKQISKYCIYTNDEMIELFKRYKSGDAKAFDVIIKSQQRLVANIALLYCRKGVPLEDIIQEGNFGLVKAAERFDYTRYRSFSNYAKSWILQSISMSMTTMPYMIRLPLNQLLLYRKVRKIKDKFEQVYGFTPSVNDIEVGGDVDIEKIRYIDGLPYNLSYLTSMGVDLDNRESDSNGIDEYINLDETQMTVKNLLKCLSFRDRQIIKRSYGINTKEENLSVIGNCFGLTRERVRQIKEKTIKNLREILQSRKVFFDKKNNTQEEDDDMFENAVLPPEQPVIEEGNDIAGAMVGDKIIYDARSCIVLEKKMMYGASRLVVRYEDGTIDNLRNDMKHYRIVVKSGEENNKMVVCSEFDKNERLNFHSYTSLDYLAKLNVITEKQLYHCNKRGLKNIGDVKHIIQKYNLTPNSTRFTKYTIDMWFGIVRLLEKPYK